MHSEKLNPRNLVRDYGFWMAVLLSTLVIINLTIFYKMDNIAHAGISGLCWLAVFSLLWDRRKELEFKQQLLPIAIGVVLVGINLWFSKSIPDTKESNVLSVMPFVFSVGVALIASGFAGLKQFRGELLIVFIVGVPRVLLELYTNISPFTAKVSSFILHYAGFPVMLVDKIFIYLPNGAIKVYSGCSGVEAMTYVLSIATVSLIMFPIRKQDRYYVPIIALAIGFIVNAGRVVLMAILVNYEKMDAFHYWHEGEGSLIFGMIAVCIFAGFYWLLMNKAENSNKIDNRKETAIREESFF